MVALCQPLLLSLFPISHHHAWRCFFFWHQDHTESFFSLARPLLLLIPPGPDAAEAHVGTGRHSAVDSKYIYNKEKVFPRMRSERGEGKKAFWHKPILLARLLFLPNWVKNLGAPSPSPLCCTTSQKETLAPNSPSYIAFCCTAKHSFFSRPSLCNVNLSRPRNQHDVGDSKIVVMKRVRFSSFVLEPCCLIDGLYCCSFLLFGTVPCHIFSPPSLQNISHAAEKLRA